MQPKRIDRNKHDASTSNADGPWAALGEWEADGGMTLSTDIMNLSIV